MKLNIPPGEWRCKHRHTGLEHPACYKEMILSGMGNIGFLDIETSNLDADFGIIYCWSIKTLGGKTISSVITKDEILTCKYDSRVVKELIDELSKYNVIVTYYGTRFDIPYIRSRALANGYDFVLYGALNHIDLYYVVRNRLKLHRNRIENAGEFLGFNGLKTRLKPSIWIKAQHGDEDALKYILEHNKRDVVLLEKIYLKLFPYMARTRRSI